MPEIIMNLWDISEQKPIDCVNCIKVSSYKTNILDLADKIVITKNSLKQQGIIAKIITLSA